MAIVERIITVYNDKGSKQAVKDLKGLEKNFINAGKKIGKAFAVATVAVGAFAVKTGVDAVKGAIEDQKSQALLANALRNTTGATDSAIKATEEYISKQQMLVAVSDTELRQSLITLTTATGDLTQAQVLQNVALDTAAGTQKDLQTVSLAIAKAYNGNIGALTKLGVSIDKTIVKNKDFKGAVDALTKAYGGAAITAADTLEGRLRQLQIAYGEILETLGYALLPVIREFAEYIVANVLPAIQSWVDLNKDNLASGLKTVTENVIALGKAVFGFVDFISRNQNTIKIFGSVIAGIFVASKIYAFSTAIALLIPVLRTFAATAASAGVATALLTGGFSAGAATAALGAFAITAGALGVSFAASAKNASKAGFAFKGMGNISMTTGKQMTGLNKVVATNTNTTNNNTNATKQLTAAEKKAAEVRAAIKKAGLDVFGIKNVSDTDPIQLEAARLNLLKQNNIEEQRRLAAIIENMNAQMKANQAVERYVDLLGVVADQVISDQEVILLAGKWGISKEAVVAYTTAIFAVNDTKLSTEEIDLLAKQWGITKKQAEMYLDFFKYINDGKLDQSEVNALMDKWGLTNKEVKDYADKIAKGVVPSDIWPTPGNQAAQSWKDALAALNAYMLAAGTKLSPTMPTAPVVPSTPAQITAVAQKLESFTGSAASAFGTLTTEEKAVLGGYKPFVGAETSISAPTISGPSTVGLGTSGTGSQLPPGVTINMTVQGSVTSENDLVTTIRNGLLQGQNNGQDIFKSAVAI